MDMEALDIGLRANSSLEKNMPEDMTRLVWKKPPIGSKCISDLSNLEIFTDRIGSRNNHKEVSIEHSTASV